MHTYMCLFGVRNKFYFTYICTCTFSTSMHLYFLLAYSANMVFILIHILLYYCRYSIGKKGSFVPNIDSKFISHSNYYYIIHMYFYFSFFFFRFFGVLCNKHTDNLNCFNLLLKEYPENIFQLSGYY